MLGDLCVLCEYEFSGDEDGGCGEGKGGGVLIGWKVCWGVGDEDVV